jgi:hypothetical protein
MSNEVLVKRRISGKITSTVFFYNADKNRDFMKVNHIMEICCIEDILWNAVNVVQTIISKPFRIYERNLVSSITAMQNYT